MTTVNIHFGLHINFREVNLQIQNPQIRIHCIFMVFPELERIFLFLDKMQKARIIKEKSDKLK